MHWLWFGHWLWLPEPAKAMFWSVCIIYWFVYMYVTNFSQKLLDRIVWNFQGWFVVIQGPWLDYGSDQVKGQGQGHEKVKNYWTELHEIFRDDLSSSKDQSVRFWEWSGQRSRLRSRKGQKLIFVIILSFRLIHMKYNAKMSTFQFLILWYGNRCVFGEGMRSTKCPF